MASCGMTLNLTLTFPDALAAVMQSPDLPRRMLEAFALEGYREGTLTKKQVRLMLGHDSRWETEEFLTAHGLWPCLVSTDVAEDGRRLNALLSQ
jgi:hypothetical protein